VSCVRTVHFYIYRSSMPEGVKNMKFMNDTEKVQFLIALFDNHMEKLPNEGSFKNYIESIQYFLKTNDSIIQKTEISNSNLFFENLEHSISEIDSLISYFER